MLCTVFGSGRADNHSIRFLQSGRVRGSYPDAAEMIDIFEERKVHTL